MAALKVWCDTQLKVFIEICKNIQFPVSQEKTSWGEAKLVFLGLLVDSETRTVGVPAKNIRKAIDLIQELLESKKTTVHKIQKICGFLNFLGRAVIPGRAFTRRLYSITAAKQGKRLKQHHHVQLTLENKADLRTWFHFLHHPMAHSRPFMDFSTILRADQIKFYTDALKNPQLGCGGWCEDKWFYRKWDESFIKENDPSIAYLELYGVSIGLMLWMEKFSNRRILINCDNQAAVQMINKSSLSCKHCMILIRKIIFKSLIHNVWVFALFVPTEWNGIADALSRFQWRRFEKLMQNMKMKGEPEPILDSLWPMSKVWWISTILLSICRFEMPEEALI